jgi:hypothetical protein
VSDDRLNGNQEATQVKRLAEATYVIAAIGYLEVTDRAKNDDGDVQVCVALGHNFAQLDATHNRHHQVGHYQVGKLRFHVRQGLRTVMSAASAVTRVVQDALQQMGEVVLVIYYEHSLGFRVSKEIAHHEASFWLNRQVIDAMEWWEKINKGAGNE